MPARARRSRIAAAASSSAASASSQPAGKNSRQFSGQEAASVTAQIETPIWQLPTLPGLPEYCRVTPGEASPSLTNPVSSPSHASGATTSTARWASRCLPGQAVLSGFVLELVAHTHDLAVSTDQRQPLDQRLAEAAHRMAERLVPPALRGTGGAFAGPVPAPPSADAYGRLAAFLGRVPR
jgi:hypothetical protein